MSQERHDKRMAQMNLHPCEERTDGKRCRKESIAMTALGKLLCEEHCTGYENKWNLKLSRLQLMVPQKGGT